MPPRCARGAFVCDRRMNSGLNWFVVILLAFVFVIVVVELVPRERAQRQAGSGPGASLSLSECLSAFASRRDRES